MYSGIVCIVFWGYNKNIIIHSKTNSFWAIFFGVKTPSHYTTIQLNRYVYYTVLLKSVWGKKYFFSFIRVHPDEPKQQLYWA